ncbi:MAG: hypothetical protein NTX79_01630 [Candidatus Micrarchaeota archaeon]|nr:hypothetical protein [Candidatus Micrarchaeota archaeon]
MSSSPSPCRYEDGKPGKRHKDSLQLKDAMFASARRQTSKLFQCLDEERRGSFFAGDSKKRKGVSINPYIDPSDFLVRISCSNLGCKHRKLEEFGFRCLLEGPYMLPKDLVFAIDLSKRGQEI